MSNQETQDEVSRAHDHEHVCIHELDSTGGGSILGAAAAAGRRFARMPAARLVEVSKRALTAVATGEAGGAKVGSPARSRMVLLGTAGGPPPTAGRAGIASAMVVGDGVYLVDCGRSALTQFMNAGLDLSKIKGVFITHMHLDHVIDLFQFFGLGLAMPFAPGGPGISEPVPIFGPRRASMKALPMPVENPIGGDNPLPGTADLLRLCTEAMAMQLNQMKMLNAPDVRDLMDVRELPVPDDYPVSHSHPPLMDPFPVFENDDVKVTATMVPHVFPSYAFRFDSDDGSFVISGDTSSSENLIALSKDADVLQHEVVDLDGAIKAGLQENLAQFFALGHTKVEDVGPIAQAAGAKHLVLSHLIPCQPGIVSEAQWRRRAKSGYEGKVIVGRDLMQVSPAG